MNPRMPRTITTTPRTREYFWSGVLGPGSLWSLIPKFVFGQKKAPPHPFLLDSVAPPPQPRAGKKKGPATPEPNNHDRQRPSHPTQSQQDRANVREDDQMRGDVWCQSSPPRPR